MAVITGNLSQREANAALLQAAQRLLEQAQAHQEAAKQIKAGETMPSGPNTAPGQPGLPTGG